MTDPITLPPSPASQKSSRTLSTTLLIPRWWYKRRVERQVKGWGWSLYLRYVHPFLVFPLHWWGLRHYEEGEYTLCIMSALTYNAFFMGFWPDLMLLVLTRVGLFLGVRPLRLARWNEDVYTLLVALVCSTLPSPRGVVFFALVLFLSKKVDVYFPLWFYWLLHPDLIPPAVSLSLYLAYHMLTPSPWSWLRWYLACSVAFWVRLPSTTTMYIASLYVDRPPPPSKEDAQLVMLVTLIGYLYNNGPYVGDSRAAQQVGW